MKLIVHWRFLNKHTCCLEYRHWVFYVTWKSPTHNEACMLVLYAEVHVSSMTLEIRPPLVNHSQCLVKPCYFSPSKHTHMNCHPKDAFINIYIHVYPPLHIHVYPPLHIHVYPPLHVHIYPPLHIHIPDTFTLTIAKLQPPHHPSW